MFSEFSTGLKPKVQWNKNGRLKPGDFNSPYRLKKKGLKFSLLKNIELFSSSVKDCISYTKKLAQYTITNSDEKSWQ